MIDFLARLPLEGLSDADRATINSTINLQRDKILKLEKQIEAGFKSGFRIASIGASTPDDAFLDVMFQRWSALYNTTIGQQMRWTDQQDISNPPECKVDQKIQCVFVSIDGKVYPGYWSLIVEGQVPFKQIYTNFKQTNSRPLDSQDTITHWIAI